MILEVRDLNISFPPLRVVGGVSFGIDEGDPVALVGESASGKTMTALSVMRLLPQSAKVESGEIFFEGKNLLELPDEEMRQARGSKIAMIFQEPFTCLNPVMRVGYQIKEAILAHASRLAPRASREKVLDLLRDVHIKDAERVADSYPHQLSGGQRQRIMIAMALAMKPRILIADEPTTALDVTVQAGILKLLKELKERYGMSMLFITHDLAVAKEIAQKILVMQKGKIVESGSVKEVFRDPKTPYTRQLLDSVPRMR